MTELARTELRVEAEVNPTEDSDKVRVAVERIFGELPLKLVEEQHCNRLVAMVGEMKPLSAFRELLKREQIRAAARKVLFSGIRGNTITFYLNKQVAYVGHISFSQSEGESPLGPIRVEISCDNPPDLIGWLASRTPK